MSEEPAGAAGAAGAADSGAEGFGRLVVERSGGIGGMLVVWEVDIDTSSRRDDLGRRVTELPWSDRSTADPASTSSASTSSASTSSASAGSASAGADRFDYLIESRFGRVRFGEGQMPQEWRRLVDEVREVAEPQRRRPD
ncbi:protealysin inhibitor emfourin [Brevibacterium oceani]|uniref:protealysin inhibitor emfourin n=1 Tax=Brevibacterium oceani TaxID=358099 RepID=UPI001B344FCB|nr:protealysin inhibitor emfourin [Brevibacterium oceani]